MHDLLCNPPRSRTDYAIASVFLLIGVGAVLASIRTAATLIRPGDSWVAHLSKGQRLYVTVVGLASGVATVVLTGFILLFCR